MAVGGCVLLRCVLEALRPYAELDLFVLVSLAMYWNNWSAVLGKKRHHMTSFLIISCCLSIEYNSDDIFSNKTELGFEPHINFSILG